MRSPNRRGPAVARLDVTNLGRIGRGDHLEYRLSCDAFCMPGEVPTDLGPLLQPSEIALTNLPFRPILGYRQAVCDAFNLSRTVCHRTRATTLGGCPGKRENSTPRREHCYRSHDGPQSPCLSGPNSRMKRIHPADDWPDSWKYSYPYDLQEIYGEVSHLGYAYAYETRRRKTLRLVTDVVPPGATILDVAAAQGNFSLILAEMGYRVTWNDLRADLADYVRLKHDRGDLSFAPGNVFELKFPSLFDALIITEIIEHVAHPDELLASTAKLVKPGGYVIMTTPNGAYCRNKLPRFSDCRDPALFESMQFRPNAEGHIFLLHPNEIAPLAVRAGLELDQLLLFTNPLTNGHLKTEALLRLLPKSFVIAGDALTQALPRVIAQKLLVHLGARFKRP